MLIGLVASLVWVGTLPWGAFPPPRVAVVQNTAATVMVLCVLGGLLHALWVTSP